MNRLDVAIIGAGQAGLAMGRELVRRRQRVLIFDGAPRVGDSWRERWDSLRLFTPARHSGLPGLPFPGDPGAYPGKDAMASYLEAYAHLFSLPLALDEPVVKLSRNGVGFVVRTGFAEYQARLVVVATGPFHRPAVPAFAATLPAGIAQLHSSAYRRPSQLPEGPALVVGAGNSGVQIAAELARTRLVTLAIGTRNKRVPQQLLGRSIFDWLIMLGLARVGVESPLGRRLKGRELLIGDGPDQVSQRYGVRLSDRFSPAHDLSSVAAIIWATGYRPDYPWLMVEGALGADGAPAHRFGLSAVPGLAFIGLPWQRSRGSATLFGVGRDVAWLAARME